MRDTEIASTAIILIHSVQEEGLDAVEVTGRSMNLWDVSSFVYAAGQITFLQFIDTGINVYGSPESLAFMQRNAGGVWKRDPI